VSRLDVPCLALSGIGDTKLDLKGAKTGLFFQNASGQYSAQVWLNFRFYVEFGLMDCAANV
jgi:hypothetical protein